MKNRSKKSQAQEASLSAVGIALITTGMQMVNSEPRVAIGAIALGGLFLFVANYYRDVQTGLKSKEIIDEMEKLANNDGD